MIAQVQIKEVYGNTTIYPLNEQAQVLAQIAGTKTLTPQTVKLAKLLGFHFEIVQPSTTL